MRKNKTQRIVLLAVIKIIVHHFESGHMIKISLMPISAIDYLSIIQITYNIRCEHHLYQVNDV